jgi:hypothetical protein
MDSEIHFRTMFNVQGSFNTLLPIDPVPAGGLPR